MRNWKRVVWLRPVVSLVSVGLVGMETEKRPHLVLYPELRWENAALATARKNPELQ